MLPLTFYGCYWRGSTVKQSLWSFADLANEKSEQSKVPPEASACTLWGVVWVA